MTKAKGTPHCDKHLKYIPSCKACKALREVWLEKGMKKGLKKGMTDKNSVGVMPLDEHGNPLLTEKFERIMIHPKMVNEPQYFLNKMDKLGYDFLFQLFYAGNVPILCFKRNDERFSKIINGPKAST